MYVFKQLSRALNDVFPVNNQRTRKAKHFLITIPSKVFDVFLLVYVRFSEVVSHITKIKSDYC